MAQFFQQVVSGLASGGIYGSLALALVLIHRATGVINFAQGEMAMFSTYIAWTLTTNHGVATGPRSRSRCSSSFVGGIRDPPGGDPPRRAGIADPGRDRHDRPAAHAQRARDVDLDGRGAGGAEPVPRRHVRRSAASRSAYAGHRHDRRLLRGRGRPVGVLPVHEGRARDARRRGQSRARRASSGSASR